VGGATPLAFSGRCLTGLLQQDTLAKLPKPRGGGKAQPSIENRGLPRAGDDDDGGNAVVPV
jgi:hypothetical protein